MAAVLPGDAAGGRGGDRGSERRYLTPMSDVFLVLATGAVGLAGIYLGHLLTRQSAIEAEERLFRRERRKHRVQPVLDFTHAAKQFTGEEFVTQVKEALLKLEKDENAGRFDDLRAEADRVIKAGEQATFDLLRALWPAVVASPNREMMDTMLDCHHLVVDKKDDWLVDLRDAIEKIEDEVDDWISGSPI